MTTQWIICAYITLIGLQLVHSQTPRKTYVSEMSFICNGEEYELGCGNADGSRVMNVTLLLLTMDSEDRALTCDDSGLCNIEIQKEGDVNEEPLINLYKSILMNCQGKPKCRGRVPLYTKVGIPFPVASYDGLCGFEDIEYLSSMGIFTRCVEAGTVSPVPSPVDAETTTLMTTGPATALKVATTPTPTRGRTATFTRTRMGTTTLTAPTRRRTTTPTPNRRGPTTPTPTRRGTAKSTFTRRDMTTPTPTNRGTSTPTPTRRRTTRTTTKTRSTFRNTNIKLSTTEARIRTPVTSTARPRKPSTTTARPKTLTNRENKARQARRECLNSVRARFYASLCNATYIDAPVRERFCRYRERCLQPSRGRRTDNNRSNFFHNINILI